jgi:hypothetical protein
VLASPQQVCVPWCNYLAGSVLEHPCGWGWRWPASSRSWTPGVALGLLVVLLRASPLEQIKSKQQDKPSSLEIKIADQLNYLKSAGSSVASLSRIPSPCRRRKTSVATPRLRKRNRGGRGTLGHGWACSCPHVPSPRPAPPPPWMVGAQILEAAAGRTWGQGGWAKSRDGG